MRVKVSLYHHETQVEWFGQQLTRRENAPATSLSHVYPMQVRTFQTKFWLLSYRFGVRCAENYYDADCSKHCKPRDDLIGHWKCGMDGERICLPGWRGEDCSQAICASGCSQEHGSCIKPNECLCRPGYSGADCTKLLCYPGCAHGYCTKPWECICEPDWGGILCELHLNPCKSRPCIGEKSICLPKRFGGYTCNCSEDRIGERCEGFIDHRETIHTQYQLIEIDKHQVDSHFSLVQNWFVLHAFVMTILSAFLLVILLIIKTRHGLVSKVITHLPEEMPSTLNNAITSTEKNFKNALNNC